MAWSVLTPLAIDCQRADGSKAGKPPASEVLCGVRINPAQRIDRGNSEIRNQARA
jgi:hypothetical protein